MVCGSLYCSLGKTSCQELSKHRFNLVSQFGECISKTCFRRREGSGVQEGILVQADTLGAKLERKWCWRGIHGISGLPDLSQKSEGLRWRREDHLKGSNSNLRCGNHIQLRVFPGTGEVIEREQLFTRSFSDSHSSQCVCRVPHVVPPVLF